MAFHPHMTNQELITYQYLIEFTFTEIQMARQIISELEPHNHFLG
jgi:hypothetical protein